MRSFHERLQSAGVMVPKQPKHEADLDARWRALTQAGNQAFADLADTEALRLYQEALAVAEQMFEAAQDGGSPLLAPMAYNISCANVAEAMLRNGDRPGGRRFLLRAFDKLLTAAEAPSTPVALRVNCVRHLRYSFEILSRDFGEEMKHSDINGLVARGIAALREIQSVAGWMTRQHRRHEPPEQPEMQPAAGTLH